MPKRSQSVAKATQPSARWRRRSADRPDEILDAALEVFIEAGFDTARMEDIAARAGISKAGGYLYFDSKVALLKALITREVAPVTARAAVLAKAGAAYPEGTLRLVVQTVMGAMVQPRVFAVPRLLVAVSNRFPDIAQFYRTEVIEQALAAMKALILAGAAKGIFRDVDPDLAVRSIIGPMMFTALWRHVFGGDPDEDPVAIATEMIDVILNGLRRSPA
jgi:AcrR family transcriptional regulator